MALKISKNVEEKLIKSSPQKILKPSFHYAEKYANCQKYSSEKPQYEKKEEKMDFSNRKSIEKVLKSSMCLDDAPKKSYVN